MKGPKPIPYVDWENHASPFITARHQRWRAKCNAFVDKYIMKNIAKWEKKKKLPREIIDICYKEGIYAARYPAKYGGTPFEGEEWDNFMSVGQNEALARTGSGGGLATGIFVHWISIPPVMHFGNEEQKQMFKPVVRGEKIAALAISESGHGSDVAGIRTTARREGEFYIVNGEKKWISKGHSADYFVSAVRTGTVKDGHKGISLLIVPRTKGVTTALIPTQGHWLSETTQVFFKDVKVPVSYRLGKENQGFYYIMYNFNQERLGIAMNATCCARECLIEAVKYARTRKVFGRPLIQAQVIRHKIAEMARQILATYNFMEKVCYQMNMDPLGEKDESVGANVALFKVQSTKVFEFCAREASQIFGGKSYVLGSKIDRLYRDVRAFAIYGGSEEIMLDVSTRLARL